MLWKLQAQYIMMAIEKKIQGTDEIVHSVYYQDTNLMYFEYSYYHLRKIGDKVKYEEPRTHQPPV